MLVTVHGQSTATTNLRDIESLKTVMFGSVNIKSLDLVLNIHIAGLCVKIFMYI